VRSLIFAVVLGWALCWCGPSYQAVNECDARFEHCYALDLTSGSQSAVRRTCWRDWLRGYTYGQSRDRVEYAATRLSQLSLESTMARGDLPRGPAPVSDGTSAAAPMPTNAFVPPPNVAPTAGTQPGPSAAIAPGSECAEACVSRWRVCREPCKDKACALCDRTYRACASACFREEAGAGRPVPSAIR
jgi:hypothetical protein